MGYRGRLNLAKNQVEEDVREFFASSGEEPSMDEKQEFARDEDERIQSFAHETSDTGGEGGHDTRQTIKYELRRYMWGLLRGGQHQMPHVRISSRGKAFVAGKAKGAMTPERRDMIRKRKAERIQRIDAEIFSRLGATPKSKKDRMVLLMHARNIEKYGSSSGYPMQP